MPVAAGVGDDPTRGRGDTEKAVELGERGSNGLAARSAHHRERGARGAL